MTEKEPTGDYIETFTGKHFYSLDPSVEMVELEDIAHALSNICRFNGHTNVFYSVAEHSVHASMLVPRKFAQEALLHDAAEAFLLDVPRPLKQFMCFAVDKEKGAYPYSWYESKLLEVIFSRFGLKTSKNLPEIVKEVDNRILATEYREFVNEKVPGELGRVKPYHEFSFGKFGPGEAKQVFLNRARELKLK